MSRLPCAALVALLSLAASPSAMADRSIYTGPREMTRVERPERVPLPVHTERARSTEGSSGACAPGDTCRGTNTRQELRPDARGQHVNPAVDGGGASSSGVGRNVEVSRGKPQLRSEPRRDTFMPVDQEHRTGSIRRNIEVSRGQPNLRTDPKRDTFMPVDEEHRSGAVHRNVEVSHGRPNLRPVPGRDDRMPVDAENPRHITVRHSGDAAQGRANELLHNMGVKMPCMLNRAAQCR